MVFLNYSSICPLFPDKPSQCDTVLAVKKTFASLSVIGCLFVIALIWLFQRYRFFVQRMILGLTVAALMHSTSYLLGDFFSARSVCLTQAFFISYWHWAALIWTCCITFDLWLVTIKGISKPEYEKWYHVICWSVSLFWAVIPLSGAHYGRAGAWCWIVDKSAAWRFGTWYVPLFLIGFVMLLTYGYIVWAVYRKAGAFAAGTYAPEAQQDQELLKREVKQLLAYPLIYLVLWMFPLISRIYDAVHPHKLASFPVVILASAFGPFQGGCNAVAFALDRETLARLRWTEIKTAISIRLSPPDSQVVHNFAVGDVPFQEMSENDYPQEPAMEDTSREVPLENYSQDPNLSNI